MVPEGSRMVAGGAVIPAQGLAEHVMLVVVWPGRPRASITVGVVDGRMWFDGVRI